MLKIDGKDFSDVAIIDSMSEVFELVEDESAAVMQDGSTKYFISGTKYSHSVNIMRNADAPLARWDEFYELISSPVDYHEIEIDHEQSTISYRAHIVSGERQLLRVLGCRKVWSDLSLNFIPELPQRRA